MNRTIAGALFEGREKRRWAGVALGGTTRRVASASVALAEHLFSLPLARFI
jgi:hypothetical protein